MEKNPELRKHGNIFPEPMSVFMNQVIRQYFNIQDLVMVLRELQTTLIDTQVAIFKGGSHQTKS